MLVARKTILLSALALLCAPATHVDAQTALYVFDGDRPTDNAGSAVDTLGDIDGDGFDDILVGIGSASGPGGMNAGRVKVYSGANGSVMYSFGGDFPGDQLGAAASAAGDVNGDGVMDFIAGAPKNNNAAIRAGLARVYSGADGSTLYTFEGVGPADHFGISVSGAGDVNGDGFADVIVGAPKISGVNVAGPGFARVFSGANGSILYEKVGSASNAGVGRSVSGIGDLNSDGFDEFMIGTPKKLVGLNRRGGVDVYSGIDGTVLHSFDGDFLTRGLGQSLGCAGDVNGDGTPDIISGAVNGPGSDGDARVFSGIDGAVLYTLAGPNNQGLEYGAAVSSAGDVTGDGRSDFMIAEGYAAPSGRVSVYSGATGSLFHTFDGKNSDLIGRSVSAGGDVNGDGFPELLIGAPGDDNFQGATGSATVYTFAPVTFTITDLCNGDGGDQMGCIDCPCMNEAPVGTIGGCLNSSLTAARIEVTGSTSVSLPLGSAADLRFSLSGGPPTGVCRLTSGSAIAPSNPANPCFGIQSGQRSTFFDGLRCAIDGIVRHGIRVIDSNGEIGAAGDPWGGEGLPPSGIAQLSGFVAGHNRYFQALYRDYPNLTCMTGQNTSQAVRVVFTP